MESKREHKISLLERITPLARQINCLDLSRIANICIENIPEMIGARFASLYILDETNSILHLQKCNHPFLINKIVSLNQKPASPMIMAVKSKRLVKVGDIDRHNQPVIKKSQRKFSENYKTKNCLLAPLICQDRVVGVLNLADKKGGGNFGKDDVVLVELFSQLVGASIGNINLFDKIQKQAKTDGLTGLYNLKTFYELLDKEIWRSRRYGGSISLVMIDIDNLKELNDTYGHRAGDKVIREISNRIKGSIRQIDIAARYGGDEFAVIFPNTPLEKAKVVADRIRKEVSKKPLYWKGQNVELSVSIGLGEYDGSFSAEDITGNSDNALYKAKRSGKNKLQIFENSLK